MWVMWLEPRSSKRDANPLHNEPSLQPQIMAVFRGGVTELPWGTYGHRSTHYREISSSAVSSCSINRNTCTCRPQRKCSLSSGNGVFQHYLCCKWGLGGFTLGSLYYNLWSEFNWDDCCAGRVSTCLASVPNHPVQLYLTRSTIGGTLDCWLWQSQQCVKETEH